MANEAKKNDQNSGLGGALSGLRNAIGDLTSLEVNTYIGDLSAVVEPGGDLNISDFDKLVKGAKGASGNIQLVASTKINFDGDCKQYFDRNTMPSHVVEAHAVALQSGQEVREGIIKLFTGLLDIKVT